MKKVAALLFTVIIFTSLIDAQKTGHYEVKSPDGLVVLMVNAGSKLEWSVSFKEKQVIAPSPVSMTLETGEILGDNAVIKNARTESINIKFEAINYRRKVVSDVCNQLILSCKGDFGIIFRVYNDAVAYRFFTGKKGEIIIRNEEANFNFPEDYKSFIPIQWDYRDGKIFNSSFEALYREIKISGFPKDSLAFLPVLVDLGNSVKAEILEVDLEDYPGMYLDLNKTGKGFKGVFAPYPLEIYVKGLNIIPSKRADYIARTKGPRNFPWRIVVITSQDIDLLNCDIVQKLASPTRLSDISWIKPGQVSWDWWNDNNISHVDFRSGINTSTYKYYIDFASANGIPYIIIDAGWTTEQDLTKTIPDINLEEIIKYGKQKNVGVILWASWKAVQQQMDKIFPYYSSMGIKGFKIDFFDRDDQLVVASTYEIAKLAAQNHLLVDYHGIYKPTGLQRTYPNVVGIEGVKGMENVKWANENVPRYDVTLPYIRNLAGPMDYTPGAMRNSSQENFRPVFSMPMSKGTRCHQLAMYVVFEVPLQMLSDNPTIYMKEQECTDFITSVPTTFDETIPLAGEVAEYVAIARKKNNTWYVGAMTDWSPRELTIDFSFLEDGEYQATVYRDGINADRDATDYLKEIINIRSGDKLNIKLSNGGGWAARIEKK
jgi:alpha-glucosidase